MYLYATLADGTVVVRSHVMEKDGVQTMEVHFERPVEGGFDSARCVLPAFAWKYRDGFSDEEIGFFGVFLKHNAKMLYEAAERDGL